MSGLPVRSGKLSCKLKIKFSIATQMQDKYIKSVCLEWKSAGQLEATHACCEGLWFRCLRATPNIYTPCSLPFSKCMWTDVSFGMRAAYESLRHLDCITRLPLWDRLWRPECENVSRTRYSTLLLYSFNWTGQMIWRIKMKTIERDLFFFCKACITVCLRDVNFFFSFVRLAPVCTMMEWWLRHSSPYAFVIYF